MPNRGLLDTLNDTGQRWFGVTVSTLSILAVLWTGYELEQTRQDKAWLATSSEFEEKLQAYLNNVKSALSQISDDENAELTLRAIHGAYPSLRAAFLINDHDKTALRVYPARAPLTQLPVYPATGGLVSYPRLIALVEELLAVNKLQTAFLGGAEPTVTEPGDTQFLAILWRSPDLLNRTETWPLGLAKFDLDTLLSEVKPASINKASTAPFEGSREAIVQVDGEAHAVYLGAAPGDGGTRHLWITALILAVLLLYSQFALATQRKRSIALQEKVTTLQQIQLRQTRLANLGEVSSRISHELNQPLFSIETLSATLIRHPEINQAEQQKTLAQIRSEAARAARATKAILDFSRAQAKNLDNQALDISLILEAIYPLIMIEAQRRGVKVNRRVATTAQGAVDRAPVEIFITATLTNALEAISESKTSDPQISIEVQKVSADKLSITVANNGPQISEEAQRRMFDDFYTTKSQGTGLGLSTARSLARQSGGEITFRAPAPARHPHFELTMPIKAQPGAPAND